MAVRAMLQMTIKAGHEDEFEQAWLRIAEQVRAAPGNRGQWLLRDPGSASSFVIVSDWDSREAFTAFERSPEQDDLTEPLRRLREAASMTVHELVHDIKPKGSQ